MEALDREEQVRCDLYKLTLVQALDREEQVREDLYELALVEARFVKAGFGESIGQGGAGETKFA